MSQKKSTTLQHTIVSNGFRLLLEEGYENTTYESIARESGCKKTNVQYYFPKKYQLFVLFIEELLNAIFTVVELWQEENENYSWLEDIRVRGEQGEVDNDTGIQDNMRDSIQWDKLGDGLGDGYSQEYNEATTLLLVGEIYFSFLLSDTKTRRLTCEAFSHRDVTSVLLSSNASWTLQSLLAIRDISDSDDDLMPAIVIAANGIYDYIYYALTHELPLDPSHTFELCLKAFVALVPQENLNPYITYIKPRIPEAVMNSTLSTIRKTLLS